MKPADIKTFIKNGLLDDRLVDLYLDKSKIECLKKRYIKAIDEFEKCFGICDIHIFSAPGRSEILGNHTDHQQGKVLAASVNLDAIAIVSKNDDGDVNIVSEGFDKISVSLKDISMKESEKETTTALTKGVLAGIEKLGYKNGGFNAYITSDVLIGAGLSSSAAYETIIGTIVSHLYNFGEINETDIAIAGRDAENIYFGKPCGLMDQMACSLGGLVAIDFADKLSPQVARLKFDLNELGYSLCITDTKGSHEDLNADYAAVPEEMKGVAAYLGKDVLAEVSENDFYIKLPEIRKELGDRAVLRAIHFMEENKRVSYAIEALQKQDMKLFLEQVKASGASSFQYLQNVYINTDIKHQNMSIALAVSESLLKDNGVARVHGGGFAGTIQAFVKNDFAENYRNRMDEVFGMGACKILNIRQYGGIKVI